jgi:hypothetical protein
LLVDLVLLLHSDSPFFGKRIFSEAITGLGVRVATFYELPGILPAAVDHRLEDWFPLTA